MSNAAAVPSEQSQPSLESIDDVDVSSGEATTDALSLDVIFEALKNERRRRVIHYLKEAEQQVELGNIAERIAADENDKTVAEVTYEERKRVYVALYQCHLPKLDDMGIISFNKPRGVMELRETAQQLEPYLTNVGRSREWYRYYAAIVLTGSIALTGILLATQSTAATVATMVGLLAAVGGVAMVHAWSSLTED